MDKEIFKRLLVRSINSHKYDFGHVLVIGGSPGMVGAPFLAARAALRVGAGLVTIASSKEVTDKLEKRVEEIMTLTLPPTSALETIERFIKDRKVSVLIIGPGLKPDRELPVRELIKKIDLPMIIDGGGLGALQGRALLQGSALQRLATGKKAEILTPHLGEFQRFFKEDLPKIREGLKLIAAKFAKERGVTLVLKGHPTYVACPDGSVYENTTGNPGLATAGTGDVLSGIIAGIIAQGIEPKAATKAAVYLHGLAADLAANDKTQPSMIASDVIEYIPTALKELE